MSAAALRGRACAYAAIMEPPGRRETTQQRAIWAQRTSVGVQGDAQHCLWVSVQEMSFRCRRATGHGNREKWRRARRPKCRLSLIALLRVAYERIRPGCDGVYREPCRTTTLCLSVVLYEREGCICKLLFRPRREKCSLLHVRAAWPQRRSRGRCATLAVRGDALENIPKLRWSQPCKQHACVPQPRSGQQQQHHRQHCQHYHPCTL